MNLDSPVGSLPFVGPVYLKKLKKLNIFTIEDLLNHVPTRYIDYRQISKISQIQPGETVTIIGNVTSIKNIYTKSRKKIQLAQLSDSTGSIEVVWFNQPYLLRNIKKNMKISVSGKVDWFGNKKSLISPDYELIRVGVDTIHTGKLVPIYHETYGVSSKWLRSRISYLLPIIKPELNEFLPPFIMRRDGFENLKEAYKNIHFPNDIIESQKAHTRLSFNELLFLHLENEYKKIEWQQNETVYQLKVDKKEVKQFEACLPFSLTQSQIRAIEEVLADLASATPMNRLLEGDVGSGKTVVAAEAAFVAFANGHQVIFMAPTQILAQQHYDTLKETFKSFNVRVTLVTSQGIKGGPGKTDVFVGTHALIHKKVDFENVALVVIDEQQRFGVEQRAHLITKSGKKRKAPHVLTMTATPIPRTVALTAYGDLDLSTLDELPKGRQRITTWIIPPHKRKGAYGWLEKQLKQFKTQAFIICPLIEESEIETMKQVKAATAEFQKLNAVFSNYSLGLLHGRLKAKEKEAVMSAFKNGGVDILVSTPVVEVGIDVPNATIMMIEAAERFGLSQLHQLRGRVGRGEKKSYCLLFTEKRGANVTSRLNALKKGLSGFELAELDLRLRGPGEVFGTHQHGFFDLKIAKWQDTAAIKRAKDVAKEAIKNPQKFSKLLAKIKSPSIAPN